MTLEERLERLAGRTPPGDPADVMAAARARAESRPDARNPRFLAAAAAVVTILGLAAGGLALTGADDSDSVTVAGPDHNPAQPQPSCEDITRFADSLDDTGIEYDYSTSSSPQDLAERSDVVFAGTLTGTVTEAVDEEDLADYVGFEVRVTKRFKTEGERTGDTVTVLLADGMQRSADYWVDLVPPGAPLLVFAQAPAPSSPQSGTTVVANPVEGIVTACEDGVPVGLVGNQGDWPSFGTLVDIEAAFGAGPDPQTVQPGGVDGPVIYAPASQSNAREQSLLSGVLARRGDCLYLSSPTSARPLSPQPLLWPYGTVWEDDPAGVRLAEGTFVPVGASFTAAGGIHDIERLAEAGHHPGVAERARQCASDDVDVVAYVQGAFKVEGSDPEERAGLTDEDAENIVNSFLRLAEEPNPEAVELLPFAEEVWLGLGSDLYQVRSRSQLADPAAWVIDKEFFRAHDGPFSALDVATGAQSTVVSVGEHAHCAGPPVPPPDDVADLTRVSMQPESEQIDSCLQWWTVDFFVNGAGQIEAVTLDLWEP
ncbi:MAG: hypothetical protein M3445_11200 [Actinomycetota bacterium]|nr:hypothetical protein [Actinomycetota bacterium]